mgnify:CR=1 FL=1
MKLGVLGAGNISSSVAPAWLALPQIECYAVASQTPGKAEAFAKEFGFAKTYDSYEAMAADPEVELVYVATPHSHHFEHMMLCLTHGKPVLCEKAFTMNAKQAQTIREYAENHGIFAGEAIWPRYMPSRDIIQKVLHSGKVGKIHTLTANLSYDIDHVRRIQEPALAGGALLDVGIYGLNFALMHFGDDIVRTDSSVCFADTGVDAQETITLHYRDGKMAVITAGVLARGDRKGIFYGDKGYAIVENINNPQSISVFDLTDTLVQRIEVPEQISGYEYEIREAMARIRADETESASMPLATSIAVMERMDALRREWGLIYPMEK